ncbi:SRPBCC family protein [Zoogloea sp.]|uniref:SRPBCC family protein n=2 Tax=Zoogloea sp. TaxID=49181 RepID=UPI0035B32CB8
MKKTCKSLSLALVLAVCAGSAFATQVEEHMSLPLPPAKVWKLIGDYNALPAWHPVVASSSISEGKDNVVGAVRSLATQDGAKITEKLTAYQAKAGGGSYSYEFVESPIPVNNYKATLSVKPEGKGSKVSWVGSFDPKPEVTEAKAKEIIGGIYKAGFEGIRSKLGVK